MTREQLATALGRTKLSPEEIGKAIDRAARQFEEEIGLADDFDFGVAVRQTMSRAFAAGIQQSVFFAARDQLMWRSRAEDERRKAAKHKEPQS